MKPAAFTALLATTSSSAVPSVIVTVMVAGGDIGFRLLDAVDPAQLLLDAGGAERTGQAIDVEPVDRARSELPTRSATGTSTRQTPMPIRIIFGFGFLRRSTSGIHAVVMPGTLYRVRPTQ